MSVPSIGARASGTTRGAALAGVLAGISGLITFLILHALWIVPIWFIAPLGLVMASAAGAVVGAAYGELRDRLPRRPWTAAAVLGVVVLVLLPSIVIAQVRGPMYTLMPDGHASRLVSGTEAIAGFVFGLLAVSAISGGALGWLITRTLRAAIATAAAGFALAIGPGHNIPILGGGPAAGKELMILTIVGAVAASVLVEAHARLTNRRRDRHTPRSAIRPG